MSILLYISSTVTYFYPLCSYVYCMHMWYFKIIMYMYIKILQGLLHVSIKGLSVHWSIFKKIFITVYWSYKISYCYITIIGMRKYMCFWWWWWYNMHFNDWLIVNTSNWPFAKAQWYTHENWVLLQFPHKYIMFQH